MIQQTENYILFEQSQLFYSDTKPQNPRGKFREESNVKITDWLIQKSPKKNKTDKIDKNERNDHESREDENMNIDMDKAKTTNPFAKK